MLQNFISTSVGRKQIVAVTGLLLILFLLGHLAGNLFIYLGPDAFNAYAHKMASLRPGLYLVEAILLLIFIVHMYFTAMIVLDNYKARGDVRYKSFKPVGKRSLATRLMPYTGSIILIFVIIHLLDFTFIDKHGLLSVLPDGKSYELYGIVLNTFYNPVHSAFYIVAMICVGLHLHHGVQSFMQTFGFNNPNVTPLIKKISHWFALFITIGFCSIPLYANYIRTLF